MDNFIQDLYQSCRMALHRTNPPGTQKHNYAWNTSGWFAWEIKRTVPHPITGKNNFSITESVEFILAPSGTFYKLSAYTAGIRGKGKHVRTFDFGLGSEEDLALLDVPLETLLRKRRMDPLYGSLAKIRFGKEIAALHEIVIKAVLKPVEREEVHTDVGYNYEEAISRDEKTLSSLREKPLISKMEEDLPPTQPKEKIPYWKTIDPEHPKNEAEQRAFAIVDETCNDPEYAKVSKR